MDGDRLPVFVRFTLFLEYPEKSIDLRYVAISFQEFQMIRLISICGLQLEESKLGTDKFQD